MAETSFSDLKLNSWIIRQCAAIGVKHPTPIQTNCIPHILDGEDCIGCAKTGSGKTLAFALPILQKLCEDPYGIFALILTPTRELAFQIADQFAVIGKSIHLRHCVVVGGMPMINQAQELAKKPHIVVATPGRLADHLNSCDTFTLKKIKYLVLDEADRLLIGSFDEQLTTIFAALPEKKQSLLFSATITDTLEKVREVALNKVFLWESKEEVATVAELEQFYVLCPADIKDGYLVETIRTFRQTSENGSIIIFTDTCRNCQLISMTLNEVGIENMALHAMIPQRQRLAGLAMFKSNNVKILIATDVASRGLDIPAVELVLNYTVPSVPKDYIHRVGRTARAGRDGMAISLVTPYDIRLIHAIEATINTKLREYVIDGTEVAKIFTQVSVTKREAAIKLDDSNFDERKNNFKRKNMILEGKDPDEEERKLKKLKKKEKQKYNIEVSDNYNPYVPYEGEAISLDEVKSDEKLHLKRNNMILEGKDPDKEERKMKKLKKKEKQKYNIEVSDNYNPYMPYEEEAISLDESKSHEKLHLKMKKKDGEDREMIKFKKKKKHKHNKSKESQNTLQNDVSD